MSGPGAGQRIDGYELLRELGRGGMGVVFEAQHPSLPRTVALKLTLDPGLDPELLLRFEREARILAQVRHPGVVRVHSLGRSPFGPYLIADLEVGRELSDVLREGPLPAEAAARITRDLALAVEAVHAEGCLHRDLKPENVILRTDGSPVLLDFGLARQLSGERLTQTGALLGTPAFMSPEQVRGLSELGPACDVYGLGAVLFALLTGRPPYRGALFEVLQSVINEEPRWPPGDAVPPALQQLCARAMAKAPDQRPESAAAFAAELDAYLAGDAPVAPSKGPWIAAAAAAILLLVGVAILAVADSSPAPAPEPGPSPTVEPVDPRGTSPTAALQPRLELAWSWRGLERASVARFLDDERVLAIGEVRGRSNDFALLGVADGEPRQPVRREDRLFKFAVERGGRVLVANDTVMPLDPENPGALHMPIFPSQGIVGALSFVPGRPELAVVGNVEGNGYVVQIDPPAGEPVGQFQSPIGKIRVSSFSLVDDRRVLVGYGDRWKPDEPGTVALFGLPNGEPLALDPPAVNSAVLRVALSPRERRVMAVGTGSGRVFLRSGRDWLSLGDADEAHEHPVSGLVFAHEARVLITAAGAQDGSGGAHGDLAAWAVEDGRLLKRWPLAEGIQPTSLDLSDDGQRLLLGTWGGVELYRLRFD